MSTNELKRFIDGRTIMERQWMAAYLLDELRVAPELNQTPEELAELARRSADLQSGLQRVTQAEAEAHWEALERQGK